MNNQEEEISFSELIAIIRGLINVILSYKWVILSNILIFGVLAALFAYSTKPIYVGKTTFMLDQNESNKMSSFMNMAGSFGLSSNSKSSLTPEKYVGILTSNNILRKTLLSSYENRKVIEHLIEDVTVDNKLNVSRKYNFNDIRFHEDSIINEMIIVLKEMIGSDISDEGIVEININSIDEIFAFNVPTILRSEINLFFQTNNIKKEKFVFDQLSSRVDSILNELAIVEISYAKEKDANLTALRASAKINELRLFRHLEILNLMYKEVLQKMEMARFNLLNKTAMIQVIDEPALPIEKQFKSWKYYFVYGAFLGTILSVIFVLLYDKIKQIEIEPNNE